MTPLERDIERALVRKVKRRGGYCLKWVCPGWAGVPDRIILLPGGRVCFVELKRPKGGQLSELQKWWAKKLINLGFHYDQIWDYDDLQLWETLKLNEVENECKSVLSCQG